MKIALDFDGTYTLAPRFWMMFVDRAIMSGHDVRIVTMRAPEMKVSTGLSEEILPVIYTSKRQKREFCDEIGWYPQIWVDDSPEFIVRKDVLKFIEMFGAGDEGEERGI